MSNIIVKGLTMTYQVPIRETGLRAAARALFQRHYRQIPAVQDLSFCFEPGQIVGFIGPNGAGKTTTLKMLSGILHPTSGEAQVLGFQPWRREQAFLKQIALIRGSQPLGGPGEITVLDALHFQQLIYEISPHDFRKNLAELTEMLALENLLQRQIRALSLGERMRCGIALSLLYRPRILFLDEPTLGLDVTAVGIMRRFIADYCACTGATVLLTSHYMADVEALCQQLVMIDKGKLLYNGPLTGLLQPYKLLKITTESTLWPEWNAYGEVIEENQETHQISLQVKRELIPTITARLLSTVALTDLSVEEQPLERVIDQIYREGIA